MLENFEASYKTEEAEEKILKYLNQVDYHHDEVFKLMERLAFYAEDEGSSFERRIKLIEEVITTIKNHLKAVDLLYKMTDIERFYKQEYEVLLNEVQWYE